MTRKAAAFALLLCLSVAAAHAGQSGGEPSKTRQICRGATKSLGSHIRTPRRCRSAEQWKQEDQEKGQIPVSLQVTQGQNDGQQPRQPQ